MTDSYRPPERRPPDSRSTGSFASSTYRSSYERGYQESGGPRPPPPRPIPHPANGYGASDASYRHPPSYTQSYPRPPPPPPPPRASYGAPPPMRRFGEDRDRQPPAQNDFSFRANGNNGPQYPNRAHDHQPGRQPPRGPRAQRGRHQGPSRGRDSRPFRPKVATAERPLLRFKRGSTPEQLAGMNEDSSAITFQNVDDLSDSDEQSMEESDEDGANKSGDDAPATKKVKLAGSKKPAEDEQPKWSNPELYTALPPAEGETDRKRKDVVKLIRKARIMAEKAKPAQAPIVAGDDFISFSFGEDESKEEDEEPYSPPAAAAGRTALPPKPASALPPKPTSGYETSSRLAVEETVIHRLTTESTKRKRESDEDSELLIMPKHKRGRGSVIGPGSGDVLPDWKSSKKSDPTPWIKLSHSGTENCGFRLHKEICDFYEFVRPRSFEQRMRQDLLDRLQAFVSHEFGGQCTVHPFGSFAAGLYLPNADMDIVIVSHSYMRFRRPEFCQTKQTMFRLANALKRDRLAVDGSVEVIHSAKVPIIKFLDPETRLKVDLSFENDSGIVANGTFLQWKAQFPALPILVTIVKQYLEMRGLNNVANGGIGGFSVTCLATSLLQNLPRIQLGLIQPEQHLGEMLLEFLDLYGNQFDLARTAIRMNPPGYVDKRYVPGLKLNDPNRIGRLCIIDPNRPDNDISGGTRGIDIIVRHFAAAREELLTAMQHADSTQSLLQCIIGGNYNDFLWHRWQLRQLHERAYGPVPLDAADV